MVLVLLFYWLEQSSRCESMEQEANRGKEKEGKQKGCRTTRVITEIVTGRKQNFTNLC
jgi:hypothetical protein